MNKMFGGMGNMLKQAQQLQVQMKKVQEELADKVVEASSGGGMVTVQANGRQEILFVKIDPEVLRQEDADMLQDLIVAAVNQAIKQSQEMMQAEMSKLTGGLAIPGLM